MADYVVDSNFFIQAHRFHYPMDVVPGFWSKVSELAHKGSITSIDKVKNEIYDSEDKLKQWCQSNLPVDFFQSTDDISDSYSALTEFMNDQVADAWLVAFAYAYDKVVVTQEVSEPGSKKKVKIPDACLPFNIRYLDMITLLRKLREQF
ncbi:MAG: DUF4411 domain-containing protein [Bacteroidetes bacterium SW_10_40_5]|nr:MAG: DUF4411 domain-containing protein [Bacteroidetes bacterium SW_10_40_5]